MRFARALINISWRRAALVFSKFQETLSRTTVALVGTKISLERNRKSYPRLKFMRNANERFGETTRDKTRDLHERYILPRLRRGGSPSKRRQSKSRSDGTVEYH